MAGSVAFEIVHEKAVLRSVLDVLRDLSSAEADVGLMRITDFSKTFRQNLLSQIWPSWGSQT